MTELSVVIAAFNAEATLGEQLAALARQDVSFAWEILLCDNGSTDGTADVVREWQARLPGLVLVDASARRGPGAARNVGVEHARSPLIAFCDADDVIDDDWLVEMHTALQSNDFVTGVLRRLQLNARPGTTDYLVYGAFQVAFFPQLLASGGGNLGIRRAVFQEVGGFDESLRAGEDLDLCWRIQLAGYPLVTVPEVRITVRNRENLRAVFRQGKSWGRGDRQLQLKFARVIEAMNRDHVAPARKVNITGEPESGLDADPEVHRRRSRILRILSKPFRFRRLSDLAIIVHDLGRGMGHRIGPFDKSASALDPSIDRIPRA